MDYSYDNEGNLIQRIERATGEITRYDFDHRNRLVRVETLDSADQLTSSVEFRYDPLDRLISRAADPDGAGPLSAPIQFTVYDGQHAWADLDANLQVTARYLFSDGLDEILARWRVTDGLAWYLTDQIGSVREIVDAAGQVMDAITYDSFGRVLAETNPAAGDRFKFTGREWESAVELYYFRARWYDPATGRFVSEDPESFGAGDGNLYRYVGNQPLGYIDPTGRTATTERATTEGSVALRIIPKQLKCVAEGIAEDLPEIILTQGAEALPSLSGNIVSCALLPVSAQANKKLAEMVVWLETKSGIVRFVAKKTQGLSRYVVQAVFECDGKPDPSKGGDTFGLSKRGYRNNVIGRNKSLFAHHIVPKKDSKGTTGAGRMRGILAGCCIGINDAINLVGVGLFHSKLHNGGLYNQMAKKMELDHNEGGCAAVLDTLRGFANRIKNKRLPV